MHDTRYMPVYGRAIFTISIISKQNDCDAHWELNQLSYTGWHYTLPTTDINPSFQWRTTTFKSDLMTCPRMSTRLVLTICYIKLFQEIKRRRRDSISSIPYVDAFGGVGVMPVYTPSTLYAHVSNWLVLMHTQGDLEKELCPFGASEIVVMTEAQG